MHTPSNRELGERRLVMIITREIHNKILLKGACSCPYKVGKKIEEISFDHLNWADKKGLFSEKEVFDVCMDFAKQHGLSIQVYNATALLPLCSGSGYGDGSGYGYGYGDGSGYGDGYGYGYGSGYGDGSGYGGDFSGGGA